MSHHLASLKGFPLLFGHWSAIFIVWVGWVGTKLAAAERYLPLNGSTDAYAWAYLTKAWPIRTSVTYFPVSLGVTVSWYWVGSYKKSFSLLFKHSPFKSISGPTQAWRLPLNQAFWTFRKKLKLKKLKQIIQKLNNLPTKNWFFAQKVLKLIYFAEKFAQT